MAVPRGAFSSLASLLCDKHSDYSRAAEGRGSKGSSAVSVPLMTARQWRRSGERLGSSVFSCGIDVSDDSCSPFGGEIHSAEITPELIAGFTMCFCEQQKHLLPVN